MNIRPLYTWRDVERALAETQNPPWRGAVADNDNVVVFCASAKQPECKTRLQSIFGGRFGEEVDASHIELIAASGSQRRLGIVFVDDAPPDRTQRTFRPLWSESPQPLKPQQFPPGSPPIVAFYSFKGGVGRTTILLSVLGALLKEKAPARVLVVDADMEAPGLTLQISGAPDRFTLIDYFSLVHDATDWQKEVVPIAVERLNPPEFVELKEGRRKFFFLPAFRIEQVPIEPDEPVFDQPLFAPDLLPEHLVRGPGRAFVIGDCLAALGKALEVDVVLVDLRAGVSEIASPFMLDPRIQQVLVTACGYQSFEGTRHMLRRLTQVYGSDNRTDVVLTMIPPGYARDSVDEKVAILKRELAPDNSDDLAAELATANVHEVPFAQELLQDFERVDDVLRSISATPLGDKVAPTLTKSFVPAAMSTTRRHAKKHSVSLGVVADVAKKFEYAEENTELGLLATPMVEALVEDAKGGLPATVVLGAKGAGKTYVWGQMVIAGTFEAFAHEVTGRSSKSRTLVFPLLCSEHIKPELSKRIRQAEEAVYQALGERTIEPMTATELRKDLARPKTDTNVLAFWSSRIARRLGQKANDFPQLLNILKRKNVSICLVVDGLEDAFQTAPGKPMREAHKERLRTLLSELTHLVRDSRPSHLGMVTFVRRDIAAAAIHQNFGQFENQYERMALSWEPIDALRLVAWILEQAGFLKVDGLDKAPYERLRDELVAFWRERMGTPESREPYTDEWVLAALSDYQGRLQARDIVRLVANAAEIAAHSGAYELTSASLRTALNACSKMKIEELKQETPGLKQVLVKLEENGSPEDKRVPFRAESFKLNREDIEFLQTHGIVARLDSGELLLPEIIRHGLGFRAAVGRRPAVLKMYRQSQSRRR